MIKVDRKYDHTTAVTFTVFVKLKYFEKKVNYSASLWIF